MSVGLHQVDPKHVIWMECHAHYLGHISAEAHMVKELRYVIKIPLEVGHPRHCKKPVLCVELRLQRLHIPLEDLRGSHSQGGGTSSDTATMVIQWQITTSTTMFVT